MNVGKAFRYWHDILCVDLFFGKMGGLQVPEFLDLHYLRFFGLSYVIDLIYESISELLKLF